MIDYSGRSFLKFSLGGAIAVSLPVVISSAAFVKEEVIEHSHVFTEKALSYSFTTQDFVSSYLAYGGIWIVDLLSALMIFITVICSILVAAIAL